MSAPPMTPYDDLLQRLREAALLGSAAGVLGWDERTHMPALGGELRGDQMALLARLSHERLTEPAFGDCLAESEAFVKGLPDDAPEAASLRELRRNYDRAVKLPKELVEEIARVTTRAQAAWQDARRDDRFADFLPWLERVVALKREEAAAVGWSESPYDALLGEYEPGTTASRVREVFADLSRELVPLIQAIAQSPRKPEREILERDCPVERQKLVAREVAEAVGFDFGGGRIDTTTHPFCSGIGPGDCRITTRYNARFFNEAFFGTLHEAGHGIYEQNLPREHFGTPLGTAASLGIHESQSRLWENQVGRSRAFWEGYFPKLQARFPESLTNVSAEAFHFAANEVRPSFIRVEADEATYNLHIILRFELEQALLTGDLKPADMPTAWNERFTAMMGLTPPGDREGCLQDIHWSMGGLGYFPTYTLGNLYAAQLMEAARRDLGDLDADFRAGTFGRLKAWLVENVHRHGQRYRAEELCRRVTGQGLRHEPFVAYLRGKFGALYGL